MICLNLYIRHCGYLTYIYVVERSKTIWQSKTELFEKELTEHALLFKALAHPARLRILQYLAETNTCISGDISDEIPLGRTTVNQHIKELKEVDLIQGHIEGVKTKYCLNPEKVEELKKITQHFVDGLCCSDNSCSSLRSK